MSGELEPRTATGEALRDRWLDSMLGLSRHLYRDEFESRLCLIEDESWNAALQEVRSAIARNMHPPTDTTDRAKAWNRGLQRADEIAVELASLRKPVTP